MKIQLQPDFEIYVTSPENTIAMFDLLIGSRRTGLKSAKIFDDIIQNIYADNGEKLSDHATRIARIKLTILYGYWISGGTIPEGITQVRL